jgi:uncharacterized protein (TIGR03118 family)
MKTAAGLAALLLGLMGTSALATPVPLNDAQMSGVVAGADFTVITVTGLVSDTPKPGVPTTDPDLINSWGISQGPGTPIWVSDNNAGVATLYGVGKNAAGNVDSLTKVPLTVTVPALDGQPGQGSPTGTVFSGATAAGTFDVTQMINGMAQTDKADFLFDTEDGTIQAWGVGTSGGSPAFPTTTTIEVNQAAQNASFKGLTINTANPSSPVIYAADFTNNKVEMFNGAFQQIGSFTDHDLPPGFAPFNVQELNGLVYVTYALVKRGTNEEVDGLGLGFVDVFTTSGQKIRTLVAGGLLDAPWGLMIAPAGFGKFAGDLLVGNFGDGFINAYNPKTGQFEGVLLQPNGRPVHLQGLWSLFPGSNGSIIFSSGPGPQQDHGLVGALTASTFKASWASQSTVMMSH